jgi:hypothetical protein
MMTTCVLKLTHVKVEFVLVHRLSFVNPSKLASTQRAFRQQANANHRSLMAARTALNRPRAVETHFLSE